MMAGIFLLLFITVIVILMKKQFAAEVFLFISLIAASVLFLHHITSHLQIQL